eukprot:m.201232 g.201232  ORF g.201232 m.201232 type:complete len:87 (-) comp10674_c0_seq1:3141-3401(-)
MAKATMSVGRKSKRSVPGIKLSQALCGDSAVAYQFVKLSFAECERLRLPTGLSEEIDVCRSLAQSNLALLLRPKVNCFCTTSSRAA